MSQTPLYSQLAARWQAIPRAGQWVLISALVGLAVFGGWQWQRSNETRYVPLLDGADLTSSESQRIKMAFAKANLNDFQSRGNEIFVPQHRWAVYSQSLLEHDALPEKLKSGGLSAPQVNVLATRRQQDQLELFQRKQNLRDMIIRLPFVESAIVDLDVMEPGGHYQPRQFTCIISIQPRSGQILHDDEVESIRKIVMGAVAGAAPERIYVTDLNCGITHDPQWTSGDVSTDSARWRLLQAKHELQEKIQNQLSVYGPIELAVRVGSYPIAEFRSPSGLLQQANAPPTVETVPERVPLVTNMPTVGSNSQASVKNHLPQAASAQSGMGEVPSRTAGFSPRTETGPQFNVSVAIPDATLRAYWEKTRSSTNRGNGTWTAEESRLAFDQMRIELTQRIRPLLPVPGSANDHALEFSLVSDPLAAPTPKSASAWWDRLGFRAMGAWVALTSGLILAAFLYVSTVRRSRRRPLVSASAPLDQSSTSGPRLTEIRQQIDQLIQNDPDTAARVIQQWIRQSQ